MKQLLVLALLTVLTLSGCDDKKEKDHNHVYSSSDSTTQSTQQTADTTPSAPEPAPAPDPVPAYKEHQAVYAAPSGEKCIIDSVYDNLTYDAYCDEHGVNVYHEKIPEYLLDKVSPDQREKEFEKSLK